MTESSRTQSYANHGHRPVWTYIAGVFGGAAFVMLAEAWLLGRNTAALGSVLLAVAVLALVSISRVYTVRLQNRIIRLEMRLRLRDLLPASQHAQIQQLTTPQLVGAALRFGRRAPRPRRSHRPRAPLPRGHQEGHQGVGARFRANLSCQPARAWCFVLGAECGATCQVRCYVH